MNYRYNVFGADYEDTCSWFTDGYETVITVSLVIPYQVGSVKS